MLLRTIRMKTYITFSLTIIFVLMPFLFREADAATSIVILRDGGTVEVSHYEINGDHVHMILENPPDSTMVIPKTEIEKIVAKESDDTESFSKSIGAEFVLIPAGTFVMGPTESEWKAGHYESEGNELRHTVKLREPFFMQKYPVTQKQWRKVMGKNPSYFNKCGDDCPVENVTWLQAIMFIDSLNIKEKTNKYRLPTEAEWEYAARAGTETKFHTGDCLTTDQANYLGYYPAQGCAGGISRNKTTPVGSFTPNRWGLCDMFGNVMQWVNDNYNGACCMGFSIDPKGASYGDRKVIRGCSWNSPARQCRSAARSYEQHSSKSPTLGFRVAKTPYWSSPSVRNEKTARFNKSSNSTENFH